MCSLVTRQCIHVPQSPSSVYMCVPQSPGSVYMCSPVTRQYTCVPQSPGNVYMCSPVTRQCIHVCSPVTGQCIHVFPSHQAMYTCVPQSPGNVYMCVPQSPGSVCVCVPVTSQCRCVACPPVISHCILVFECVCVCVCLCVSHSIHALNVLSPDRACMFCAYCAYTHVPANACMWYLSASHQSDAQPGGVSVSPPEPQSAHHAAQRS